MKHAIAHPGVIGLALLTLAVTAPAQTIIIESRTTDTANPITPCPPWCESGSWYNSSAKSTAAGLTPTRLGSRFTDRGTPSVTISASLQPNQTYRVDVTHPGGSNASTNLVCNVTYANCTGTATSTTGFQRSVANVWNTVGTITTDNSGLPAEITFTYASGVLVSSGGGRWFFDAIRFVSLADPCTTGLPELSVVNGPLAAGQTFVDVPGVDAGATAVSVYADGVKIGAKTNGITAGVNRVTTTPLVKNQVITVTQTNPSDIESCRPTAGTRVGGGANPRIRVSLSIRQNTSLTGPIGANSGTATAPLKFLGATNVYTGGFGLAPVGGRVIQPEACWQTVSFLRGPDPANPTDKSYAWASSDGSNNILGDYGGLESIALAIDDLTDTGPFVIYLDNIMNGDTVIQDFESATNGQPSVLFTQPSFSGSTTPYLLAQSPGSISPNISQVTTNYSDTGEKSCLVSFQFKDVSGGNWLRLTTQGSGTPNPVVDLRLPITFRMLLLPVGQTNVPLRIRTQPVNAGVAQGEAATFRVEACGMAPLQYQWYFNNTPLAGANQNVLTLTNAQLANAGNYHVVVSDPSGSVTSAPALLAVEPMVVSGMMTQLWAVAATDRDYLLPNDQQGGLAFLPNFSFLVVVSRSSMDTIRTLYAANGTDNSIVDWGDPQTVDGGIYRFHKVGATSDGSFTTGNVTTNAAVDEFRLYRSVFDQGPLSLIWHGNPGGAGNTDRWGDTMDVRDFISGGQLYPQVILAGQTGNRVAVLTPATNDTTAITFVVSNAPPGAFAHGLAWGEGDTFWGKRLNGALYHVGLNFTTGVAQVLHVYPNLPSVAAIEVDTANQLLGGISIGTPDTLRLYSIADLAAGPIPLDTAPFPTDNPNPNAVGSLAFAGGQLYALNGNNGLVAMRLRPWVRATVSTNVVIDWTGAGTLQSATNVAGPYQNVPGATKPFPVAPAAAGQRYYRVVE